MNRVDQRDYQIRCEWGEKGLATLGPISDVIVIVDILSFSTCVDIAVSRGAEVYPCRWKDERGDQLAEELGGICAGPRGSDRLSLSPVSLLDISEGTKLILPSPNGSTLTSLALEESATIIAACLRNAEGVARYLREVKGRIAIIPAGERWPDGSLRPALEDWMGAGALIARLEGKCSPEAEGAASTFLALQSQCEEIILNSSSGRELRDRRFEEDVILASELNISKSVPILHQGAYKTSTHTN